MKRTLFRAFGKKLFGAKYERLMRGLLAMLVIFLGLSAAEWEVEIAPVVFYIMTSTVTAGVLWQAFSSKDNAAAMQNLWMLPFVEREFVFMYVASFGIYAFLTKTAMLFAVVLAVAAWRVWEILGSLCCAVNAVLMTAAVFFVFHHSAPDTAGTKGSQRRGRCACCFWIAAVAAIILFLWNVSCFLALLAVNSVVAVLVLWKADADSFYVPGQYADECNSSKYSKYFKFREKQTVRVWRYLFRYLRAHKNYLANTVMLWGVAWVLPAFLGTLDSEGSAALRIGFAILSLNTPLCILLSCDSELEQAVRVLPGQARIFCVPYTLFLFFWNGIADAMYLWSWQMKVGGVTGLTLLSASFFALQSAVLSVLLEWFFPVRGWKIESDLWHHPRKYLVPSGMLLLAGMVGMFPMLLPVLVFLLGIEVAVLLLFVFQLNIY